MSAQRMLSAGLVAGGLAGIFLGILQVSVTGPLIRQAELYEAPEAPSEHSERSVHSQGPMEEEGWKRSALTVSGAVALGASLGILASLCLSVLPDERFRRKWTFGLLFGLCGFTAFHAIPSLGLPPVPPGIVGAHADLAVRQGWWLLAVATSSLAFLVLAWGPSLLRAWLSIQQAHSRSWAVGLASILFLTPFLKGIPPHAAISTAPPALRTEFLFASLATSGLFWLALGVLATLFLARAEGRSENGRGA